MPAVLWIESIAERLREMRGWRRRATAFAAGAASVLAMAPFFAWPILWLTIPALVWLVDGALAPPGQECKSTAPMLVAEGARRSSRGSFPTGRGRSSVPWYQRPEFAAAEIGWWFGFGFFVLGLFWIGEAFLVEAETFAVLLPFAVTLLPAGLALFYAAAVGLAARFWTISSRRVFLLALAMSAAEWLRGHVLSGLPWNILGYALTYPLPLMQSAAVPRHLWAHARDHAHLRAAARAVERGTQAIGRRRSRAAALATAIVPLALWRHSAPSAGICVQRDGPGYHDPHRATERPAAREVAPGKSEPHIPRPPGLVRHQSCRRHGRSCRRHPCDLARGGHAVPSPGYPEVRAAIGRLLP